MHDERYPDYLRERFWAKVDKTGTCWIWTGARTTGGYGKFRDSIGPGRNPDLTVTATGCHVWRGSTYEPCFKHGTDGCCLISHMSPAAQRTYSQPRCQECGRFLPSRDPYATNCGRYECLD